MVNATDASFEAAAAARAIDVRPLYTFVHILQVNKRAPARTDLSDPIDKTGRRAPCAPHCREFTPQCPAFSLRSATAEAVVQFFFRYPKIISEKENSSWNSLPSLPISNLCEPPRR
jgi:hypothetical protein